MKFSTSTHPSDNAKALSPSQPIGQPHFRSFRFLTHAELTYIVLLLRAFLLLFWVLCEWWRKRGERSEAHRARSTQPIKINGVTVGIRLEHKVFTSIRLLVHLLCVRDSSDWNPIGHQFATTTTNPRVHDALSQKATCSSFPLRAKYWMFTKHCASVFSPQMQN